MHHPGFTLPGVDRTTAGHAICDMRIIFGPRTAAIHPAARLHTPGDLFAYAAAAGITLPAEIKTAC